MSSYAYGYDDAGQRKWVKRASGNGDVYKYDATDQLTNVWYEASNPDTTPSAWTNEVTYYFDAAGNRTNVTATNTGTTVYIPNPLNQYTNVGGTQPSYDANGNLSFNGGLWYYTYDRESRLVEAANDGGSTDVIYTYDAFNRLIEWFGKGRSRTRFYYDDQWRVIAEYDGNDSLVAKYVYGPEIDEPVRMTRGGTSYYYHAAALGTVTEITLADQTVTERYTYDVYGEPQIWDGSGNLLSSSAIGNRFMFQGRDRDPDTGLYNFRNRYYSPSLGRFVQTDPVRKTDHPAPDRFSATGEMNHYVFVLNDPANRIDLLGLESGKPKPKPPPRKPPPAKEKKEKCLTCEDLVNRINRIKDREERKNDEHWIAACDLLCVHIFKDLPSAMKNCNENCQKGYPPSVLCYFTPPDGIRPGPRK